MSKRYRVGEQSVVDRWSGAHASMGVLYGSVTKMPWWLALGLAVGWEIVENPLKDRYPDFFPDAKHDSLPNAVADAAAVMVGYWVGRRYT
jgi:hypothetical protein